MPTQLPSGNWRPRIRHPRTGKQLNPQAVIGGPSTYPGEADARRAEREALKLLRTNARVGVTVREWWEEWTTDPLWLRPAESTNIHNHERTERFAAAYGHLPIRAVDDDIVREYRRSGRVDGTIPALRAMFNDAARADAGRLVAVNPFAGLRLPQSRGRRDVQPPAQPEAARMIALADEAHAAVVRRLPGRRDPRRPAAGRARRAAVAGPGLHARRRDHPDRAAVERQGPEDHVAEAWRGP